MIFLMELKVRFDYDQNIAYVSIGFSEISDSIMIKITDLIVLFQVHVILSKYYDNRDAITSQRTTGEPTVILFL